MKNTVILILESIFKKFNPLNPGRVRVYQQDQPLHEGRYTWSDGRYVEVFDSTVVELQTDTDHTGYGEVCPLGPFYLPAFGGGARAGRAWNQCGAGPGPDHQRRPAGPGPDRPLPDRSR